MRITITNKNLLKPKNVENLLVILRNRNKKREKEKNEDRKMRLL